LLASGICSTVLVVLKLSIHYNPFFAIQLTIILIASEYRRELPHLH